MGAMASVIPSGSNPSGIPTLDIDPFEESFLENPYPVHARLRDLAPVAWLPRYGVAAIARYEEVRKVLRDWQTFSSARGVGLADLAHQARFRLPSLLLEADPPAHDHARRVMNKALSNTVMERLRERFLAVAESLVTDLLARGQCDGIRDIAEAYPLQVFPDAIGMKREGRHNLLPYGDMVFNSFGPENQRFRDSAPRAQTAFPWVKEQALRENLTSDGFGMIVYQAVDAGEISEEDGGALVRSMLTAGVDTTVNGIGAALYCLCRWPDQWNRLRSHPDLARGAFEEAVRLESPVQTFFRTTTRPCTLADHELPEGQKVLMFLASANRDPRRWQNPDDYDITRATGGHLGFGFGIHACVGQLLARLEGEAVLRALALRVSRIEVAGPPIRRYNNTLRGLSSLPLRLHSG